MVTGFPKPWHMLPWQTNNTLIISVFSLNQGDFPQKSPCKICVKLTSKTHFTHCTLPGSDDQFPLWRRPVQVRISVQSDADITVAHQVLEYFRIHSGFSHVGAIGVATNMGRDFRKLILT